MCLNRASCDMYWITWRQPNFKVWEFQILLYRILLLLLTCLWADWWFSSLWEWLHPHVLALRPHLVQDRPVHLLRHRLCLEGVDGYIGGYVGDVLDPGPSSPTLPPGWPTICSNWRRTVRNFFLETVFISLDRIKNMHLWYQELQWPRISHWVFPHVLCRARHGHRHHVHHHAHLSLEIHRAKNLEVNKVYIYSNL